MNLTTDKSKLFLALLYGAISRMEDLQMLRTGMAVWFPRAEEAGQWRTICSILETAFPGGESRSGQHLDKLAEVVDVASSPRDPIINNGLVVAMYALCVRHGVTLSDEHVFHDPDANQYAAIATWTAVGQVYAKIRQELAALAETRHLLCQLEGSYGDMSIVVSQSDFARDVILPEVAGYVPKQIDYAKVRRWFDPVVDAENEVYHLLYWVFLTCDEQALWNVELPGEHWHINELKLEGV